MRHDLFRSMTKNYPPPHLPVDSSQICPIEKSESKQKIFFSFHRIFKFYSCSSSLSRFCCFFSCVFFLFKPRFTKLRQFSFSTRQHPRWQHHYLEIGSQRREQKLGSGKIKKKKEENQNKFSLKSTVILKYGAFLHYGSFYIPGFQS